MSEREGMVSLSRQHLMLEREYPVILSRAADRVTPKARAEAVREVARRTGRHTETVRYWFRGARAPRRLEFEIALAVLEQAEQLPVEA